MDTPSNQTPPSLYAHIAALARRSPDKAGLVACDKAGQTLREVSYKSLLALVEAAARHLISLGLKPGDKVALMIESQADHLAASWAAWSLGIITVPLDLKRDTPELQAYKIKVSGAQMTLTKLPEDLKKSLDAAGPEVSWMPGVSHPALILFTSGTTAMPKGALLSLNNLVVNARGIGEWLNITERDRFLVTLPLYHINSTVFTLATLLAGGTNIVPPGYSNSGFWAQTACTGATLTSVVPSILSDQLERQDEYEKVKKSLALSRIQIGSAPVVAHAAREFIKTFSIPLYQGYGQTETALRVTGVPMGLAPALYEQLVESNSIGSAMPWAQVEIMDEQGQVLGEGQEGELVVKGAAVMSGYAGGEEAFRDGYFLTGDVGLYRAIDGVKYFYLKGRKKEIIIKGGVNVSPVAVENSLKKVSHDIDQAYAVGIEDERYGEEVGAVICWRGGVDDAAAMRRLKAKLLVGSPDMPAYESPAYLASASVPELPTTSTGKVQRMQLKASIPKDRWQPAASLFKTEGYEFVAIGAQSTLREPSRALYNHCWQPLSMGEAQYKQYLQKYFTIGALDKSGVLQGQISFAYEKNKIACVSICSASFKPKSVPTVDEAPSTKEVIEYLKNGLDPVMNFHSKLGAELVEVIPGGRPEDASALGYTMLLRYKVPKQPVQVAGDASVSAQLIRLVLLLAQDLAAAEVYALSRPGGLASYLYKKAR